MTSGVVVIREVRTEADAADVRRLALLFVDWLRERYPESQSEMDWYRTSPDFLSVLNELLTVFNPPDGECLLALLDDRPVGILMLKRWDATSCEMSRMFVVDSARRLGIGRSLCTRLIDQAKHMGYETMMLTAVDKHHEALALYRSLNFRENPGWMTLGWDRMLCMTLDLG